MSETVMSQGRSVHLIFLMLSKVHLVGHWKVLSGLLDSSVAISPLPCLRVGRVGEKNLKNVMFHALMKVQAIMQHPRCDNMYLGVCMNM